MGSTSPLLLMVLLTFASGAQAAPARPLRPPLPAWAQDMTWKGQSVRAARDRMVVKFKKDFPRNRHQEQLIEHGLSVIRYYEFIDAYMLRLPPGRDLQDALDQLERLPWVEYAEPDFVGHPLLYPIPDDTYYQWFGIGQQYELQITGADKAWNDSNIVASKGSPSVRISVPDTGIRYTHEDFFSYSGTIMVDTRILTSPTGPGPFLLNGNIVGMDCTVFPITYDPWDCHSHGTGICGSIGAATNNGRGIAGASWYPKIVPIKVGDCSANLTGFIQAFEFTRSVGGRVMNMSWGGAVGQAGYLALQVLDAEGAILVGGVGNDGVTPMLAPANAPIVIAAGSSGTTDEYSSFSSFGPELDLLAPGEFSVAPGAASDSSYGGGSGTSGSSALTAGWAALLVSQNPDWYSETVYRRMITTADKPAPPFSETYDANGWNQHMGYGRINVYQALGGRSTSTYYAASVYLYNSQTVLSAQLRPNPGERHRFINHLGGSVTFSVQSGNPSGAGVVSAEAKVRSPSGGITFTSLTPSVVSATMTTYSVTVPVPMNLDYTIGTSLYVPMNLNCALWATAYVPEIILTHTHGGTTKIPCPAYHVPRPVPASVEAQVVPGSSSVDLGQSATVAVVVRDTYGNALVNVPVSGTLVSAPGTGAALSSGGGLSGGYQPSLTVAAVPGNHLLVFSVTVGAAPIQATLTVSGVPRVYVHKVADVSGAVCPAQVVTYTLSWSKAGTATAWDLTITDTLPNGSAYEGSSLAFWAQSDASGGVALTSSAYAADPAGPWTPGEPPDGAGPPLVLRWVVERLSPGRSGALSFSAQISSTLSAGAVVSNRGSATIAGEATVYATEVVGFPVGIPGTLAGAVAGRATVTLGQGMAVSLTVTNTGGVPVTGIQPQGMAGGGGAVVLWSGPVPGGPLTLGPGAATTFIWTYTATGTGPVWFSMTASGTVCGATPVSATGAVTTLVQLPGTLAASLAAFPKSRNIGQLVLVTVTVSNTGEATVDGVTAPAPVSSGIGGVTLIGGPTPPVPVSLAGGTSVTFTWTYAGTSAGEVWFATTVTGTEANTGGTLRAWAGIIQSSGENIVIQTPAALVGWVDVHAVGVCPGQEYLVSVTVSNTGMTSALGVTGGPFALDGGGGVSLVAGPWPSLPATIPGDSGTSWTFSWTYTGSSLGPVTMTLTLTGSDENSGATVTTGPISDTLLVTTNGILAVSASAPPFAVIGQGMTVTLTVTHMGGADVQGIVPVASTTGPGVAVITAVPSPAGPLTLVDGQAVTVTFTFSAVGSGPVVFTLSVGGTTCVSQPVVATGMAGTTIFAAGSLMLGIDLLIASPLAVEEGTGEILVRMVVRNAGSVPVWDVQPGVLGAAGDGRVELVTGPSPGPAVLMPGTTVEFAWRYRATTAGRVWFTGGATAAGGYAVAPSVVSNDVVIHAPFTSVVVYPQPFKLDGGTGVVRFGGIEPGDLVTIYTLRGLKVWSAVSPGRIMAWDGRNEAGQRVAPGTYLWVVEGPRGRRRGGMLVE